MNPPTRHFLGFDLGKDRDFSAIANMAYGLTTDGPLIRPVLDLVSLARIPLGTEYLDVMERFHAIVTKLLAGPGPPPAVYVAIDAAGPGQFAVELIRRRHPGVITVPTVLTAGIASNRLKNGKITIPRRDLLANTRCLLESGALRIAGGLKHRDVLEKEFAAVRPIGGQSAHDDLAIATGLAAWHATRVFPNLINRRHAA